MDQSGLKPNFIALGNALLQNESEGIGRDRRESVEESPEADFSKPLGDLAADFRRQHVELHIYDVLPRDFVWEVDGTGPGTI
jgi:hypothetical protein